MRLYRSMDSALMGLPLVLLGMALIAAGASNPRAVLGPEPFTPLILLVFGMMLFLFGVSFLRTQVLEGRFWRAWLPTHMGIWLEKRLGSRDRRTTDRRVTQLAYGGPDRRRGTDRRTGPRRNILKEIADKPPF